MANKFTKRPNIDPPERDKILAVEEADIKAREIPISDISTDTIEDIAQTRDRAQELLNRVRVLEQRNNKVKIKAKGTLRYHYVDADLTLSEAPNNILEAIESLFGTKKLEAIKSGDPLSIEDMDCLENIALSNTEADTLDDKLHEVDPNYSNNAMEWVIELIKSMTKQRISFGLEFLLRLIRLVMAYAVHMIIGGICRALLGKLNIPIPFIGSFPAGTLLALQVFAPAEARAKASLGFPCSLNFPPPKFCHDLFNLDKDAFNLLPCCFPAGISGMMLRIQEIQEKAKGQNSPFSSNIEEYLKSFKVKGSFKDGYFSFGDLGKFKVESSAEKVLASENKGLAATIESVRNTIKDQDTKQDEILNRLSSGVNTGFDLNAAIGEAVNDLTNSWFSCVSQAIAGTMFGVDGNYDGPPCLNPAVPGISGPILQQMARDVIEFVADKNSTPDEPKTTQSLNIMNLLYVVKQTTDYEDNLDYLKQAINENKDLLNPSTRRCLENVKSLKIGGRDAASLGSALADGDYDKILERLDTDNSMKDLDFTSDVTTSIGGLDIDRFLTGLLPQGFEETVDNVLNSIEAMIDGMDQMVSGINNLAKFASSREFCCVIYVVVLLANVARGRAVCPTDDISSFFKYSARFNDRRDVKLASIQIAMLKAVVDGIRHALAIGIKINGIKIPFKDLMDRVRYTVSEIAGLIGDMAFEPIEYSLDQLLENPEIQGLLNNDCPYAFDLLSILKCAIEWAKIKIKQLALEMFSANVQNMELMRNLRIGGMRFKMLDLLSKLLKTILDLLTGIGDCYDGDEYMRAIGDTVLESQYQDILDLVNIAKNAGVSLEEIDEWSKTIDGDDPLNFSDEELAFDNDAFGDFQGNLLSNQLVHLLKGEIPLSELQDPSTKELIGYEDFVSKIELLTGVTLQEVYQDLYRTDLGIFSIFKQPPISSS